MAAATPVQSLDTVLCADCVAWSSSNILACGTYQLDEESGIRKGRVLLYELKQDDKCCVQPCVLSTMSEQLAVGVAKPKDNEEMSSNGVLDMKWVDSQPHLQLITACANGSVTLMNIVKSGDVSYSYTSTSLSVPNDQSKPPICLSVDYTQNQFLSSDSNGCIVLGHIDAGNMGVTSHWKGHAHEAWTAIFGSDTNIVLSGGDDCRLYIWDTRCNPVTYTATKRYEMGVVSIANYPGKPMQFTTGSYDEIFSLWDQRNMKRPIQELPMGGGVWRIKWNNPRPSLVALACMHGGFKIVDITKNQIVGTHNGHESLAYGIDWHQGIGPGPSPNELLLASCSFYDHSLQLWTIRE